jgi:hypothetical protein
MKVLEFQTQIPSDGTLKLPPEIAAQIPDSRYNFGLGLIAEN